MRAEAVTPARILEAAAELFRRKGYSASSIRELAEMVGIQKPSLYHHMESKEDLLFELCVESLRRIHEEVADAIAAVPAEQRLRAAVRAHLAAALSDQGMHVVMLRELRALSAGRRREVIARRDAYEGLLQRVVADDQAAGRLRSDVDGRYLALTLLNLLNWTIVWFNPNGGDSPQALGDLLATLYLEGAAGGRETAA